MKKSETKMKNLKLAENNFRANIQNIEDVQEKTAQFWYSEAEKALQTTITAIEYIHERAYKIMTFSGISAAALFSFLNFFKVSEVNEFPFFLPIGVGISLYTIIFSYCLFITKPDFIFQLGMAPKRAMNPEFINTNDDRQFVNVLLTATESYQYGITKNEKLIEKKSGHFQICFVLFLSTPLFIGLSFFY